MGDEATFQYAIQTVIINPYISCVFPILIHKCIEYLSFGCTEDTIERVTRFLKAMALNVRCRDVYIETAGSLSHLFLCMLFGADDTDETDPSGNNDDGEGSVNGQMDENGDVWDLVEESSTIDMDENMSYDGTEEYYFNGDDTMAVDESESNNTITLLSKNTLIKEYLQKNEKANLKRKFPFAFVEGESQMENIRLMERYINENSVLNRDGKQSHDIIVIDGNECSDSAVRSKKQAFESIFDIDSNDKAMGKTDAAQKNQDNESNKSNDNDKNDKGGQPIGVPDLSNGHNGDCGKDDVHCVNNDGNAPGEKEKSDDIEAVDIRASASINGIDIDATSADDSQSTIVEFIIDDKFVGDMITVVATLSSRWGLFENQIIYMIFERLTKFFDSIEEWSDEGNGALLS